MLHLVTWMLRVRNGLLVIQEEDFLELPANHPSFPSLLKHVKFLRNQPLSHCSRRRNWQLPKALGKASSEPFFTGHPGSELLALDLVMEWPCPSGQNAGGGRPDNRPDHSTLLSSWSSATEQLPTDYRADKAELATCLWQMSNQVTKAWNGKDIGAGAPRGDGEWLLCSAAGYTDREPPDHGTLPSSVSSDPELCSCQ